MMNGHGARAVKPGVYKKLIWRDPKNHNNGTLWMSNTPAEIDDHWEFFYQVETRGGDILINGLGLGVVLTHILKFPNVKTVTVIEKEKSIIKLVAPTFKDDKRIKIIHADALKWKPEKGRRYNVVWHDIWPSLCTDNKPTMSYLHRSYARRCDWQGSWGKSFIERMMREERNRYHWR